MKSRHFFLTEEMGSRRFTQWLKENHIQVKAAIILEMIGYYSNEFNSQRYFPLLGPFYPNQGNFLAVVGNFPFRSVVSKIVRGFRKSSRSPIKSIIAPSSTPGIYFSDHWSFWQEKIPAIMITDTAYLRNPNYHQDSDRASTLDYKKMAMVIHGLKEAIIRFTKVD